MTWGQHEDIWDEFEKNVVDENEKEFFKFNKWLVLYEVGYTYAKEGKFNSSIKK